MMNGLPRNLFLYGPPGCGKTTSGKEIAARFGISFVDLDEEIERDAGNTIPGIFATEGEAGFRKRELAALRKVAEGDEDKVVALGGGALLGEEARRVAEASGRVVCFECPAEELQRRIDLQRGTRPLVAGGDRKLFDLLERRREHYASFRQRVDVSGREPGQVANAVEAAVGRFRIETQRQTSDVFVGCGIVEDAARFIRGIGRKALVVCDANVADTAAAEILAMLQRNGIRSGQLILPPGEENKTLQTVQKIWDAFLASGIDRHDFAIAVGGGVTGDMTGFAAATWMRGIPWVNFPTTLLSAVDASTGGKTGCDLPGAKNMIGAFHSPACVFTDIRFMSTLPMAEWRCGMAEALKHAVIADPGLASFAAIGPDDGRLAEFVARTLAVKVDCVRKDPFEKIGMRAKLNLGHTVGHALEAATNFAVKHGEAVAIGTVEEARLAVRMKRASKELPEVLAEMFAKANLPTKLPEDVDFKALVPIMFRDKKKDGDEIRFALPIAMGQVDVVPVGMKDLA